MKYQETRQGLLFLSSRKFLPDILQVFLLRWLMFFRLPIHRLPTIFSCSSPYWEKKYAKIRVGSAPAGCHHFCSLHVQCAVHSATDAPPAKPVQFLLCQSQ